MKKVRIGPELAILLRTRYSVKKKDSKKKYSKKDRKNNKKIEE